VYLSASWTKPHPLPTGIFTEITSPNCKNGCLRSSSLMSESSPPTNICNRYPLLRYQKKLIKRYRKSYQSRLTVVLLESPSDWEPWATAPLECPPPPANTTASLRKKKKSQLFKFLKHEMWSYCIPVITLWCYKHK